VYPSLSIQQLVTVREVATARRVNEFTIYHWLRKAPERLPPAVRLHGRVFFAASEVEAWMERLVRDGEGPSAAPPPQLSKRGRPKKEQQVLVRRAATAAAAAAAAANSGGMAA
jgi:predicted DNA-binding transcriptional regulator AlpA